MATTIIVSKTELQNRFQSVSKIISSKTTQPILEYVQVDIQDGLIKITAAGNEGRMSTTVEGVHADNDISICIHPRLIIDALESLPEQPISISIKDDLSIIIRYKGGKFEMMGNSIEEFPKERNVEDAQQISFLSKLLLNGIEKTLFCAANDELRPVMNGVFLDIANGQLNFVSSDGHKFALLEHFDE